MEELITASRDFAYSESDKTTLPIRQHIDLTTQKAIEMAKVLGVRQDIVEVATLLMDAQLGQSMKEGRQTEHSKMGVEKAEEIIQKFDISEADKENIKNCILEHHGSEKFYSLESEICCNADCYRFASIKGFGFALRYLREMPFEDLVKLLKNKADEKWNAISLDSVKKELTPEYDLIMKVLEGLK